MELNDKNSLTLALGFGAIAGSRSFTAPAMLSYYLNQQPDSGLASSNLGWVRSPLFTKAMGVLATTEVAGDKSSSAPDRINAGGVIARLLMGAFAGAAVYAHRNEKIWQGALAGGAAAVISTYLTYYLRKRSGEAAKVSDKVVAIAEDIATVGAGKSLTRK
jgi:uncharacterized membrane protein